VGGENGTFYNSKGMLRNKEKFRPGLKIFIGFNVERWSKYCTSKRLFNAKPRITGCL
jgi:hypothetical protein